MSKFHPSSCKLYSYKKICGSWYMNMHQIKHNRMVSCFSYNFLIPRVRRYQNSPTNSYTWGFRDFKNAFLKWNFSSLFRRMRVKKKSWQHFLYFEKTNSRIGGSRRAATFLQESVLIAYDFIWKLLLSDRNFSTLLDPPLSWMCCWRNTSNNQFLIYLE